MISDKNIGAVILAVVFGIMIFFAAAWSSPSYWDWSVLNPNLNLPVAFTIIALIALTAFIPAFGRMLLEIIRDLLDLITRTFNRLPNPLRLGMWLTIGAGILYLARGFTYLYGDGNLIISHIENGSLISTTAYGFSLFIKYVSGILGISSYNSAANFMAWISIACGVIYFYFLYKILSLLIDDEHLRPLLYVIAATSAVTILFTGYVETYSILTAWLAIYFFYSLKYLSGKGRTPVLILLFAAGVFWHVWFAAFMPTLLYALNRRFKLIPGRFILALSVLYVLGIIIAGRFISRSGIPPVIPILPNSRTDYALVSPHHLLDFFNIMVIAGPVMILLGLILAIAHAGRKLTGVEKLLLFAGIPALIIAFFLDPALGAIRDWDVLSIFSLPIILIGIVLLGHYLKERPGLTYLLVPILLLGILHTGAFIALNKNTDFAVDRIIRVLREDPHYFDGYYGGERIPPFSSIISNEYKRHKEGAEFMQRKAQSTGGSYFDLIQLGYQYYNQKDYENTIKCFDQIPMQELRDPETRFCYASALFYLRHFEKAGELFGGAAQDTSFVGLYFFLSNCMLQLGNSDSSYQVAVKGVELTPDTAQYINDMAMNYYINKDYKTGMRFLKATFGLRPDEPGLILIMGRFYESLDQPDSAQVYYQRILQNDPANINALLGMVYVQYSQGDYKRAFSRLTSMAELSPDNPEILLWMAKILRKQGELRDALDVCAKALHLSPNNIPLRQLAGQTFYDLGYYERAVEQWGQILMLDSNNADAILGMARGNDKMDSTIEAVQWLTRWKTLERKSESDSKTQALLKKYDLDD